MKIQTLTLIACALTALAGCSGTPDDESGPGAAGTPAAPPGAGAPAGDGEPVGGETPGDGGSPTDPDSPPDEPGEDGTPSGNNPAGGKLEIAFPAPAPTTADRVLVSGTVSRPAHLVARLVDEDLVLMETEITTQGEWSLDVTDIPFGHSVLEVTDGVSLASATLVRMAEMEWAVDYGGWPGATDSDETVLMDIEAFASAPEYEGRSAPHPGTANAHDLMATWIEATGSETDLMWSESLQGYAVLRINGAGAQVDSTLAPPYWCYLVNGEAAEFGITLQPVAPGDRLEWVLGGGIC